MIDYQDFKALQQLRDYYFGQDSQIICIETIGVNKDIYRAWFR